MRRKAENRKQPTARKKVRPIDTSSGRNAWSLQERVAALERRFETIEDALIREGMLLHLEVEKPEKKKPGPAQTIRDEYLFDNRMGLTLWLERVWPEISPELRKPKTGREMLSVLERFANPTENRRPYEKRLLANPDELLDFVRNRRFNKKPPKQTLVNALTARKWDEDAWKAASRFPPRQIANAMAGVPDIDWRTSLDRCSKCPLELSVGGRTSEYYRKLYGLPAYYVLLEPSSRETDQWTPIAGPFYSKQQAKPFADKLRAERKVVYIKSEADLEMMGQNPGEVFNIVTGMEPVNGPM